MSDPERPEPRKALLLLYRRIEFVDRSQGTSFRHSLSDVEVEDAIESFRHFPELVTELTHGLVVIECDMVSVERSLVTLTAIGPDQY